MNICFQKCIVRMSCASAFVLVCLCGVVNTAQAAGPATLNYQGFLTDQKSGVPVNTSVSVTFKLYDALVAGNLLYTETQSLGAKNGVINAQIGSITSFPASLAFDKPYWLEVTVGSDTLSPRQAVASSAFAQNGLRLLSNSVQDTAAGDGALAKQDTAAGDPAVDMQATRGYSTAVGYKALGIIATGRNNSAFGWGALGSITTGNQNTAVGAGALQGLQSGGYNVAIGAGALSRLQSGDSNYALGPAAGAGLTTGSGNLYIGESWTLSQLRGIAESNTMRIGGGLIKRAVIAGVRDVTPGADNGQPVVVDTSGQFGTVPGISLTTAGLSFGITTRQMLNLWGTNYGVGVQNNMLYTRTADSFAWYMGGVHSDTWNDPGAGGTRLMGLGKAGLRVVGSDPAGANDITLLADGSIHAKVVITSSDRNAKENFANIDPIEVLTKVVNLPLQTWNYRNDDHKVKHIGPVAQDFQAAFNVGVDDKHIATVDADGVALAAIQGLYRMVEEKDDEIARLKASDASTRAQLKALKEAVELLLAGSGQTKLAAFKP